MFLIITLLSCGAASSSAPRLHVDAAYAVSPDAPSDGTEERPFVTLEQAKEHLIGLALGPDIAKTIVIHPGIYAPLSIDHAALSSSSWEGMPGSTSNTIISGGIQVPASRFKPWSESHAGAYVASLDGLGADDLGAMMNGDCVNDCQHDKVGVSFNGDAMTLARWPNAPANTTAPGGWAHASHCTDGGFTMDLSVAPDAERLINWANESEAYVHGYWQWDWADCYGKILDVSVSRDRDAAANADHVRLQYEDALPGCKDGARWMGVNLLCELDAPGEFYIDKEAQLLYAIPPDGQSEVLGPNHDGDGPVIMLTYQQGGVLNISSAAQNVRVAHVDVRDGRHAGILAAGTEGTRLDAIAVHGHGTNGIVLTDAPGSTITNAQVFDVGCTGVRATAGDAATLRAGKLLLENNAVHHYATWKRSYQPGIFWGGVGNTFRGNSVSFGPHNGFLGGGDFADGVNNLFEQNHVADCTFDTIDSGGFYTCGQRGAAFTNRGNVLRNNTFVRIRNTAGLGVQVASNQAVYLDDQMSGWLVANNTFTDCQIGLFVGGGRRNLFHGNSFVRCGTVFYLNNQGMPGQFDNPTVNCSAVAAPFETTCSTGAAEWMLTKAPAAAEWAANWPEMADIRHDYLGYPAHTELVGSTYCCADDAHICELISSNTDLEQVRRWQVKVAGNVKKKKQGGC